MWWEGCERAPERDYPERHHSLLLYSMPGQVPTALDRHIDIDWRRKASHFRRGHRRVPQLFRLHLTQQRCPRTCARRAESDRFCQLRRLIRLSLLSEQL